MMWITATEPGQSPAKENRDTIQFKVRQLMMWITATEPGQSPANVATSITYLPFGPVSGLTHGNGLTATFTHDLDYRTTGNPDWVGSPGFKLQFGRWAA